MLDRCAIGALALGTALFPALSAADARTDGSVGPVEEFGSPNFEVPADVGLLRGSVLLHSFERFGVAAGGSATFTPGSLTSSVTDVIARVTGGSSSLIDGTLASALGEQRFFLVNPAGLVFGPEGRLDLPGAFFATTAGWLEIGESGALLPSTDSDVASSSDLNPTAFGFSAGATGPIRVSGVLEVATSRTVALIGGDIEIESGAFVSSPQGRVALVSVASAGSVRGLGSADAGLELVGFSELADISIRDESVVSSSGYFETFGVDLLDLQGDQYLRFGTWTFDPTGGFLLGTSSFADIYFRPNSYDAGSGPIEIRARNLEIVDSELRAANAGGLAGDISIDLSGDLLLRRQISLGAVGVLTGGIPVAGVVDLQLSGDPCECRYFFPLLAGLGGSGPAGSIRVEADDVDILDGAAISSVSFGAGEGGAIDIAARGRMRIAGRSPEGEGRGIFSNAQGFGRAGDIRVSADLLRLEDRGAIIAQTTGDAEAGDITIDVGRLEIIGASQVDSSTSAQSLPAGYEGTTSGSGGEISVLAREGVSIAGRVDERNFARISTFSQARSEGRAGDITVKTPRLVITNGGGIAVTSEGPGDAGSITLEVGELDVRDEAAIAASAEQADGGDVNVAANGLVYVKNGTLSARAPVGTGGNVRIDPRFVVLNDADIVADAVTGQGGDIDIASRYLFRSADTRIDASSQFGVSGTVVIRSPEVDLTGELAQLPADLLGTDAELDRLCAERGAARQGSFVVGGYEGTPDTPDRPRSARYSLGVDDEVIAAHRRGDLESEVAHWRTVSASARDRERAAALIELAQGQESLGAYSAALASLEDAERWVESAGTPAEQATLLAIGGRIVARRGAGAAGLAELDRARSLVSGPIALRARIDLDRGHLLARLGRVEEAAIAYAEAERTARKDGSEWLAALARAEGASDPAELAAAARALAALPATHDALFARIHVGRKLEAAARSRAGSDTDEIRLRAGAVYADAAQAANEIGAPLAASYGWGYLGSLYEQEGRSDEALELTRRALVVAARAESPESLYLWQWQLGRLESARGHLDPAIRAYEVAHRTLRALRTRAALDGAAQRALAREFPLDPVARGLVDVLLQRAAASEDVAAREALLRRARDRMEDLNAADLQDYFEDECVAARRHAPADALPGAAVLYPISLPDRLELVLSLPSGGIRSVRVPVSAAALAAESRSLVRLLQDPRFDSYLTPATQLYDWLVRPIANDLESADVRALVVVPSVGVRGIPFAALYDSRAKSFLIQRHPVAVVPGLSLTDPRPIDRGALELLKAGLTKAVQGYPALPRVADEVATLGTLFRGPTLLDEGFVTAALAEAIEHRAFGAVHLASHAEFGASADEAFVLTYDEKLGVARLAEIVRGTALREQPLELLALSACQTALGDERAALGIAGLAVKAGARSTLATLWSVDDEATSRLVADFYRRLSEPGTSRAAALQGAQLALLESGGFAHPTYWSPFLLIGSWL